MGQLFYVLDTELRYTGCFHTRKHRERGVRKEISIFRKRDLGFSPKARILLRLRYFSALDDREADLISSRKKAESGMPNYALRVLIPRTLEQRVVLLIQWIAL